MNTTVVLVCLLAAGGLFAGCRSVPPSSVPDSTTPTHTDADVGFSSVNDDPVGSLESNESAEAEAARRAFADEVGVDVGQVTVVDVEPVTWNDSALGCGQPGQSYLQVLTPGYRITVEHDGNTAVYHTDRANATRSPTVVRCDKKYTTGAFEPVKPPPLRALAAGAIDSARIDLEKRIGSDVEIALEDVRTSDVTDLVCGELADFTPGTGPARVILELHLRAGDDIHAYRAWTDEVLYCGLVPGPAVE